MSEISHPYKGQLVIFNPATIEADLFYRKRNYAHYIYRVERVWEATDSSKKIVLHMNVYKKIDGMEGTKDLDGDIASQRRINIRIDKMLLMAQANNRGFSSLLEKQY